MILLECKNLTKQYGFHTALSHVCLGGHMRVQEAIHFFEDFYVDFSADCAHDMLDKLDIDPCCRIKSLSKGTAEKVQLILTMSRQASLYLLDEPIAGVDPAARDYILRTIISNYNENASILISTHLISDIENILDEVIFIQHGSIRAHCPVDSIRQQEGFLQDADCCQPYVSNPYPAWMPISAAGCFQPGGRHPAVHSFHCVLYVIPVCL